MNRTRFFGGGSAIAIALTLGISGAAWAQADTEATEVEEVVVTGSLIRGTPEDAALPVDVISQEDLEKQGSPSTVELIKSLPVSNGVLGDTNQFDSRAQGSEGSGSVNLRGLGPHRSLVLLNGRRLAINPFALAGSGAVDTNTIPAAAIGRVEVLKEGAAATYGSDAIGGVVNFITRRGFDGVEMGASYRFIEGSDGDWGGHVNFGKDWDRADAFVSLSYHHRSELAVLERDWANLDYEENPEGGWSAAGSPPSYVPLRPILLAQGSFRTRDAQCGVLGGYEGFSGFTPTCQWHYTLFDNLVEEENRYQAYGEFNYQVTDTIKAHFDVLWSSTDVPHWRTSPSYALLSVPTASVGSVSGNYFIPTTNPGLVAYLADHPTYQAVNSANGATTTRTTATDFAFGALVIASRPFALGGNPMFENGPSEGRREFDAYRFSGNIDGEWGDNGNWNIGTTYAFQEGVRTGYDTVVNRYQLALRGYGSLQSDVEAGGGCTAAETTTVTGPWTTGAGNAALGCYYFNPFSNAIEQNAITGEANPEYEESLANSADLASWFFVEQWIKSRAKLLTFDAVIGNQFAFTLPGGNPAWAVGAQYRIEGFETELNEWYNREVNPCIDTPTHGTMDCANPNGPLAFLGVATPVDLSRNVAAVFGELSLPVTDAIQVQLAARYENYGAKTGNTFDPKISVRWQLTDMFALRASAGSTFRAPALTQTNDNFVTSLQNIGGTFRAVDIYGNPDLSPERAKTLNFGVIAEVGSFNATLDYWSFDFENPIVSEPVAGIVNAVFPTGLAANCTTDGYEGLVERFTFNGSCAVANVSRLRTNTINGAGVKTSGLDFLANYDFGDLGFAELNLGTSVTYVLEYKVDATTVEGIVVEQAFDAVGLLNYQTTAYPLPQLKGEFFVELSRDVHNLRWTTRYMDSYTDQRTAQFAAGSYRGPTDWANVIPTISDGKEIDSTVISDLTYRGQFPMDTTLVVSIENIFDQDPSFARLDLNYDPFTGDPLGRTVKVSLTKRF